MLINKSDEAKSFFSENGEHHRKQGPQSSRVKKKNYRSSEFKIYFYCCAGICPYTVFPWVMLAVENKT